MVPLNASKFDGGRPERVLDIVTKNETLVYWYDQENKKQSLVPVSYTHLTLPTTASV